jgi:hemerythrin superfamily protein
MAKTPSGSARREVLDALIEDHKLVKLLFREFERVRHGPERGARQAIAERVCSALDQHATLEEELFYPALRGVVRDDDLLDEAGVEHGSARALMAELRDIDADDPRFGATFTVLAAYVKHHIREEEGQLFQQLTRARVDWEGMRERIAARRAELADDGGQATPAQVAEESGDPVGQRPGGGGGGNGGGGHDHSPGHRVNVHETTTG